MKGSVHLRAPLILILAKGSHIFVLHILCGYLMKLHRIVVFWIVVFKKHFLQCLTCINL